MNTDIERTLARRLLIDKRSEIEQMMKLNGADFAIAFAEFVWIESKRHTIEMQKPIATIKKRLDHHGYAVYVATSLTAIAFDFASPEDAAKWANEAGYRAVIE